MSRLHVARTAKLTRGAVGESRTSARRLESSIPHWLLGVVACGVVAGVVLRIWILASSLGTLDGDEALVGLMARHILKGEFTTFFWGQNYGGSQEPLLAAPLTALAPSSPLAIRVVPILLFAVGAVLVWRVGKRTVGEPAALIGAVLAWFWPSYVVWKSTKAHDFYGSAIVLSLAAVLLVLRLHERYDGRDAVLLGLTLGLGLWSTPQVGLLALPALGWLLWRRRDVARGAVVFLPAAVLGALPWLLWNVHHGWRFFHFAHQNSTYFERLRGFFSATLPSALGVRVPWSLDWLPGSILGRLLVAAMLAYVIWLLVRARGNVQVLLIICAAFPFLYAVSPFTGFVAEPRYLILLVPVLALLLARLLTGPRRALVGLAVALALSVAGLASMERGRLFYPLGPDVRVPANFQPLISALDRFHENRVFANYWVATRLIFETRERIIAASTRQVDFVRQGRRVVPVEGGEGRHPEYDRVVRHSRDPGHVFVAGSALEKRFRALFRWAGYRRTSVDGFVVYSHHPATVSG